MGDFDSPTWRKACERLAVYSPERVMPTVPGANAGRNSAELSTDSWRTDTRRDSQAANSGSGHAQRFGVRPWAGSNGDQWTGAAEITPADRIAHANRLAQDRKVHGSVHRLLEDAGKREVGLPAPTRKALQDRCKAIKVRIEEAGEGSEIIDEIGKALGL